MKTLKFHSNTKCPLPPCEKEHVTSEGTLCIYKDCDVFVPKNARVKLWDELSEVSMFASVISSSNNPLYLHVDVPFTLSQIANSPLIGLIADPAGNATQVSHDFDEPGSSTIWMDGFKDTFEHFISAVRAAADDDKCEIVVSAWSQKLIDFVKDTVEDPRRIDYVQVSFVDACPFCLGKVHDNEACAIPTSKGYAVTTVHRCTSCSSIWVDPQVADYDGVTSTNII